MLAGILLGLSASACWAVANVAVQRSGQRVGAFRALLWAQLLSLPLLAPLLPADARTAAFGAAEGFWLLGVGAASLLAYVSMFYAFEHGKLTVAVPLMSSWAVIAAALSLVLFDERLRAAQVAGGAAVIAGALVVSRFAQVENGARGAAGGRRWLLASAGAAIGFGVAIPALGHLVPAAGSFGAVGLVYLADIALGLPLAALWRVNLAPPRGAWLPVALAGLFETAGFVCIALGGRYAPLALVSPLSSLAGAFTVLYAWAVMRERPRPPVLVGAGLVCTGVVVLAL